MAQLNDIVWAKSDDGFWPGIIVRPKMGNLRIWRFSGRIHVRYFRKTAKSGQLLTGWVKEEDLVPSEMLRGPSGFQDLSLQRAYEAALRKCNISRFVPQFASYQVIASQKAITTEKTPENVQEDQKVRPSQEVKSSEGPSKIFNIFSFAKRVVKDEEVKEPKTQKVSKTRGWSKLLTSMRPGAESRPNKMSQEEASPSRSLKRR